MKLGEHLCLNILQRGLDNCVFFLERLKLKHLFLDAWNRRSSWKVLLEVGFKKSIDKRGQDLRKWENQSTKLFRLFHSVLQSSLFRTQILLFLIVPKAWDFPGGPVVKNLPSNAGDVGLIPDWGTKIPHATGQLSPCATTTELTCPN